MAEVLGAYAVWLRLRSSKSLCSAGRKSALLSKDLHVSDTSLLALELSDEEEKTAASASSHVGSVRRCLGGVGGCGRFGGSKKLVSFSCAIAGAFSRA